MAQAVPTAPAATLPTTISTMYQEGTVLIAAMLRATLFQEVTVWPVTSLARTVMGYLNRSAHPVQPTTISAQGIVALYVRLPRTPTLLITSATIVMVAALSALDPPSITVQVASLEWCCTTSPAPSPVLQATLSTSGTSAVNPPSSFCTL